MDTQTSKSSTPRTDAEHAKTLTPAYEHEGAEWEAWDWAKKLEIQLAMVETLLEDTNKLVLGHVAENMKLKRELKEALEVPKPLPFSELF